MARTELPSWRRRAQVPALVFAAVGIAASAVVIVAKTSVRSEFASQPSAHGGSAKRVAPPFDLSQLTIPSESLRSGGPPKDGIPALTDPAFVAADEVGFLSEDDEVIGVFFDGEARAYPLLILDYHEIVNDTVGGQAVAVTYCPLCDSSVVFDRGEADPIPREFGVSGRLFNSNVLMFDRPTDGVESLWSQMGSVGVSGPGANEQLRRLPVEVTTWSSWRERHPQTKVLSDQTGYNRRYDRSVYASYFARDGLMFDVDGLDDRLAAKTPILGVISGGTTRAYRNSGGLTPRIRRERLGEASYDIVIDDRSGRLRVENVDGDLEWCYTFWFAWAAFNPASEIADLTEP